MHPEWRDKEGNFKHKPGETMADRQERCLIAFRNSVTDGEAAKAAGISRDTLYRWIREDVDGFSARYDEANRNRLANLESRMFDVLNWASTPENYDKLLRYPNLLMFALKGAYPERYGDKGAIGQDEAKRLFDQLMKMKDDPKVAGATDVKSVDDQLEDILGGI